MANLFVLCAVLFCIGSAIGQHFVIPDEEPNLRNSMQVMQVAKWRYSDGIQPRHPRPWDEFELFERFSLMKRARSTFIALQPNFGDASEPYTITWKPIGQKGYFQSGKAYAAGDVVFWNCGTYVSHADENKSFPCNRRLWTKMGEISISPGQCPLQLWYVCLPDPKETYFSDPADLVSEYHMAQWFDCEKFCGSRGLHNSWRH